MSHDLSRLSRSNVWDWRGRGRRASRLGSQVGALVLASLSGLHLLWATGTTWPAGDESALADSVAGTRRMPGPTACLAVGAALAAAATLMAAGGGGRLNRGARAGIAGGFLVRGAAGVTGHTGRLVSRTLSAHFVALDRRYYGPLCLAISASATCSLWKGCP